MSEWQRNTPDMARSGEGWYDRTMASPPPPSLVRLALLASLLHFAFDAVSRVWAITTPAYLQLAYMGEPFREILGLLGVDAVSAVTAAVTGLVSGIFAMALQEAAPRRRLKLGLLLFFLWCFTGGLTFAVYLDAPWWVEAGSLAAGLPRAAAIAFFLDRLVPAPPPRPAPEAPGDGAAPPAAAG
jgi:hypothetical protein